MKLANMNKTLDVFCSSTAFATMLMSPPSVLTTCNALLIIIPLPIAAKRNFLATGLLRTSPMALIIYVHVRGCSV